MSLPDWISWFYVVKLGFVLRLYSIFRSLRYKSETDASQQVCHNTYSLAHHRRQHPHQCRDISHASYNILITQCLIIFHQQNRLFLWKCV